jgi:hypothetical protein
MLCEKYKDTLIETAGSGTALDSSVGEHVSLCAHCQEILAAQQSMFALVDAGLRTRANITVPGNFGHRVRAAIQMESPQERRRYSAVLAFGSLAAAAALLIAILLTPSLRHGGRDTAGGAVADTKLQASPHPPVHNDNATNQGPSSPGALYSSGTARRTPRLRETSLRRKVEPEVLVPRGQEELLVKYMQGIAARKARVTLGADLQQKPDMKPVEVPSIEISELVVTPLPDLSSN